MREVKTRLFRITQASENSIPFTIMGLKSVFGSDECDFVSEFDPKTGDYYVVLVTSTDVAEALLLQILTYK
jgi:hypothetical protein